MEASEPPKHEHFSIRGFVADMRKKDLKTCYPFAPQGNDVDPVNYQLPPLSVPEFRWWQCSSCIPNAETKTTTKEMVVATTHGRDNTEGEDSDQSKINKTLNLCSSDFTCSKGKADIRDIEARNSLHMSEVNLQQVFKRLNNTPVEEPGTVSYGRDGPLSALASRRKPKLRSLADILVEERTQTSSIPRTRSASSSGMKVASTEMESVLVPQHQVDVPASLAEAERKRKISLREDTEPLLSIFPRAFAKRTKGIVLDPKKVKAIDANKKMRHTRRDNEMAQMGEPLHPNNMSSASLQEQTQKIGAVDDPLLHPRKSIFGNSNGGGTMELGLSLNSFKDPVGDHNVQSSSRKRRYIPDLNVEIPEMADMEEEQQFTTLSKERSFPLQKTHVNASASASAFRSYKTGKRITDPGNKDNNAELGASDDIPIEIVELLAKSLHERERGNPRRRDTTERHPSAAAFPLPSSINVSNGNMGVQPNKYQMDMRKLRQPECPSIMAGAKSTTWEEMLDSRAQKRPILPSPVSFLDKWRSADGKGKKVATDVAELREDIGSSDPSQSDKIPAMQLLSLMEQRVKKSDPSYKVGQPLSPCKYHPRLNGKENLMSFLHFPENGSSSSLRVTQDEARSSKGNEEALGECTLNRNPADFSIPQVGNEFTITSNDLKRGKKTNGFKGKSRLGNVDGRKRGRKPRRKRV
ncbi:uncharacterized protein LOC121783404 isoform X2 [Salvia splendens]|uniref:uncharacterized protein LOC121783404 isoform X2 n=1 Tax=Salvia splendens TaxID=180675 RepID=UPI001C25F1F4|nr:uncharacterized protein LOC121783404 isoform X2 [Salvia splendens]